MAFYQMQVGADIVTLPDTAGPIIIPPRAYLVVCRNLYTAGGSPGFEAVWGNNTGVWGDDSLLENYMVVEAAFVLPNSGGSVALTGLSQSILSWTSAGGDGISWERVVPGGDAIGQSRDPAGATPGQVNSLTPVARDLALDTVQAGRTGDSTTIAVTIVNRGLDRVNGAELSLWFVDMLGNTGDSLLASVDLPPIDSGFSSLVVRQYALPAMYTPMEARLSDDDRPGNNRLAFVAPGDGYPPLIVNEFLPNPQGLLTSEWVEIRNLQDTAVRLSGWRVGDALGDVPLVTTEVSVPAGGYAVAAQDSAAFRRFYWWFEGLLLEPAGWPVLNNTGDIVRLLDPYGLEASRVAYEETFTDNITWSRGEAGTIEGVWGRSDTAGGTPGRPNRIRLVQRAEGLVVTVTPEIIAPDGDGRNDEAVIRVTAPPAESYTIRVYDRTGRVIRTLEEKAPDLAAEYRWDGRTDSGRRVPIGIYILYVEAEGVESRKLTVVVAR